MMSRIAEHLPGAAVSSDFIVGFCGETEKEFQLTVDLVEECRFKNSFIFKYSERTGTKAQQNMPDDVPYPVKQRRNNDLLAVQNRISLEDNQQFVGQSVDVLVEGPSKQTQKRDESGEIVQLTGRTHCDRIVVFDGHVRLIGQTLPIGILEATPFTLLGTAIVPSEDVKLVQLNRLNDSMQRIAKASPRWKSVVSTRQNFVAKK